MWTQGRVAWPDVDLPLEALAEQHASGAKEAFAADLYLAAACGRGVPEALAHFRAAYEPALRRAVGRQLPEAQVDDALQLVLTKLLVGREGHPPAIRTFGGRSRLATWLKVVARRTASNYLRDQHPEREVALEEAAALADYAARDAALGPLKKSYREAFRTAFAAAIADLPPKSRNLLRYECVDKLSRRQVASIYGVTEVTVSRWRAAMRVELRTLTRRHFVRDLELGDDEFDSAVGLIASQLEVSLSRLLRETDDD